MKRGRPVVRTRSDLRLTVRFRYHCDEDLIDYLEQVGKGNRSAVIREALREYIESNEKPDRR